ncbi:AAA family ATPase [Paractinoplanes atraurantiacus]|uniref:AAA family ATPase n=1 Tax=Paractinoplanes atraurantiacus TaxID=1036182 RepID=UPI003F692EBF
MLPEGTALRGRDELLATIESRLATGGGIALHGPAGIGKTALLDAVASAAAARGELVIRLRPVRSEHALPYAGISDLVTQLPEEAAAGLPPAQRAALAALRQGLPPRAGAPALARRLVLPLLLARAARCQPVLLVLDDCQWLDAESAELIAFAMRRRPGPRVRAIAAQRRPDAPPPGLARAHPDISPRQTGLDSPDISPPRARLDSPDSSPSRTGLDGRDTSPPQAGLDSPNTSPASAGRGRSGISPASAGRGRSGISPASAGKGRSDISPALGGQEEPDTSRAPAGRGHPDISSELSEQEESDISPAPAGRERSANSPTLGGRGRPEAVSARVGQEQSDLPLGPVGPGNPDVSPGRVGQEQSDLPLGRMGPGNPDLSPGRVGQEQSDLPLGPVGPEIPDFSPARVGKGRSGVPPVPNGWKKSGISPVPAEKEHSGTPMLAGREQLAVMSTRPGREQSDISPASVVREQPDILPARGGLGRSEVLPAQGGLGRSEVLPAQGGLGRSEALPAQGGLGRPEALPAQGGLERPEALPARGGPEQWGAEGLARGNGTPGLPHRGGQRRVEAGGQQHRAARLCPAPVLELAVPPLSADDLTELLEARGLPCRIASRMHEASAGNPFLALTLGEAVAPGPAWRPAPLPEAAREMLGERLAALGAEVRRTLLTAALAVEPTVTVLLRAGRDDAVRDLRHAAGAGVVRLDGEAVRFTPPLLATVLTEEAGARERVEVHTALAAGAVDPVEALRHRALRNGRPDAAVARSLATAADRCAERGAGRTAAELYLLAADRCPHTHAALRLDWLVAAARTALTAGAGTLAGRAAEAVIAGGAPAGHRVRARVVLLDLAGQGLADMGETFAAALAEAGDDPALLAPVRLRLTWAAFLTGDPDAAEAEAGRTVGAARSAGDPTTEAMALSILAQIQRLRGEAGWPRTLRQALALPATPAPDWLHYGPRYMAARFAMVDDRLDEARDELLKLLVVAEQDRIGEARVEVLRSLSEVATRAGRCREALRYAHRAVRAAQHAGLSPGPTWHTAAVAELAGGSLAAATGFARRGVRASEQEGDTLYLRRNLHALGQAELRAGRTRAGVAALLRLRELEAETGGADPMIVRWHGDLAGGLAALGEHAEAEAMLAEARAAVHRLGDHPGLSGYLDRATAVVLSESGQAESAVRLSAAAAQHFAQLHQPIEQAHALLVQGSAERRRRRYAAARVAIGAALAIFLAADAKPWAEQTERALARTESNSAPLDLGLTSTELRIAALVRDGASNREIASRLFLSVKTIEATLTRIYRKLGVRSRTQLSSRLPPVAEFTSNV